MTIEETLEEIEQALLNNPFDAGRRFQYAELLLERGKYDAALRQYELLISQGVREAESHNQAGLCLIRLGRTAEAERHFTLGAGEDGDDSSDEGSATELEEEESNDSEDDGKEEPSASITIGAPDEYKGITVPSREAVRFSDIAGMADLKKTLRLKIIDPFTRPGLFARFKKKAGGGVLLYGPPGCGKTFIARAVATEVQATFFSIGISDVINRYWGESERRLEAIFSAARQHAPSVLFFDELDALAYSRSKASSEFIRTIVNEFLRQLDGVDSENDRVLVLGATNMPWDVDSAMKRPGRFSRQIFVPPPDEAARAEIFRLKLEGVPAGHIDFTRLAKRTVHFSGADVEGVIDQAKERALDDILESGSERELTQQDLEAACASETATTLDWLRTAQNLVKYGAAGSDYSGVAEYLKATGFK